MSKIVSKCEKSIPGAIKVDEKEIQYHMAPAQAVSAEGSPAGQNSAFGKFTG